MLKPNVNILLGNKDKLKERSHFEGQTLVTAGPVLQIHFSNIMLRIFNRSTLLMVAISLTTACMSVQKWTIQLKRVQNGGMFTLTSNISINFSIQRFTQKWMNAHQDKSDRHCLCIAPPNYCAHTKPRWVWLVAQSVSVVLGCLAGWISVCFQWQNAETAAWA